MVDERIYIDTKCGVRDDLRIRCNLAADTLGAKAMTPAEAQKRLKELEKELGR